MFFPPNKKAPSKGCLKSYLSFEHSSQKPVSAFSSTYIGLSQPGQIDSISLPKIIPLS